MTLFPGLGTWTAYKLRGAMKLFWRSCSLRFLRPCLSLARSSPGRVGWPPNPGDLPVSASPALGLLVNTASPEHGSGDWTQVLMPVWQALSPTTYPCSLFRSNELAASLQPAPGAQLSRPAPGAQLSSLAPRTSWEQFYRTELRVHRGSNCFK